MDLAAMCIESAAATPESVEKWRRQRRTLERLPSPLANALFRRLQQRRLLFPSLLEVFQHSVEEIDLKGESFVDVEWMAYIGAFRNLRCLILADCKGIDNAAIWPIAGMSSLKELDLSRCSKITDAGIKHILSIENLEKLKISETKLTANGVMLISSLRNLHHLDLGGIPVTDEALESLKVLTKLDYLDLWGSKISDRSVSVLQFFPKLSFLNVAWTHVTKLPSLPLVYLNMSNCTIHSIFNEKCGSAALLQKLVLLGAKIIDDEEVFSNVDTSRLTLLDISGSSILKFNFLAKMNLLEHLNLSFCRVTDSLTEYIVKVAANLKYLDLSHTMLTSRGVTLLTGHVVNLQTLSLSHTATDDVALSYIGMMPSLRKLDLSYTNIKGYLCGDNMEKMLSLTALQNLHHLESLNLEELQLRDEVMSPLRFLSQLHSLYLKSDFLSDISFHLLSSLVNLKFLGFCGAVLTNSGLLLYVPPRNLNVLDLGGCWLLTKDAVLAFCKNYPQLELRHEHAKMIKDQNASAGSSPLRGTHLSRMKNKTVQSTGMRNLSFADERIKYSREEMLGLQRTPPSDLSLHVLDVLPAELRNE